MSNFQPELLYIEPRASQWVRFEFVGDRQHAMSLVPQARKTLGMLHSMHGVAQSQMAARDVTGGGGFYHRWERLPDGSQIHAMTNDGHDTVRIYTGGVNPKPEKPLTPEEEIESTPYMWVGVRVKEGCERPWWGLNVILVEPDGTGVRGVMDAQFLWSDAVRLAATGNNDDGWVVAANGTSNPATLDEALADMYQTWFLASGFSHNMIYGDHQFDSDLVGTGFIDEDGFGGSSGDPQFTWTANGVMMQHWLYNPQAWGPYDPLMTPDQNAGLERGFSGLDLHPAGGGAAYTKTQRFGWDVVAWLDPLDYKIANKPGMKLDDRPLTLATKKYLKETGLMRPPKEQVQEGIYKVAVQAYDAAPELRSTRSGEAIPDFPSFPRSGECDYLDYMQLINVWPPLEVEVEVRLGRKVVTQRRTDGAIITRVEPAKVFNFDLVCTEYDERFSVSFPFGSDQEWNACTTDGGPNMGGPSISQWIDINVKQPHAELSDVPPARTHGTAPYHAYSSSPRSPSMFFIYGNVFPAVDSGDWEAFAADALFTALETVTSGVYGCSEMNSTTEGQLLALFSGTSKDNVYRYDPVSGTLDSMGPPATVPADWAVNDPPDDSTNFYWYYENAVPYKNDCYNTFGVLVTSVGGAYEMSQNFVNTPGYDPPDCC